MSWTWILAAASLVGVVLNIRRRRACFVIWTATTATWCAVDARAGLLSQASLMALYALAVWGFFAWRPPRAPS